MNLGKVYCTAHTEKVYKYYETAASENSYRVRMCVTK